MLLRDYIKIFGTLFYGSSEAVAGAWSGLSEEDRGSFLKRASREGASPVVYRQLFLAGVREGLEELQRLNLHYSSKAMRHQCELMRFTKLLEGEKIRYALLKGTDLAFRVYPSPALRPFSDWDILFHPEDIRRALQLIERDGWIPIAPFPKENEDPTHFHYPLCHRKGIALEPHWTLPMFDGCTPEQIWKFLQPGKEGSSRYLLDPALNLLLLTRHAAEDFYNTMTVSKLLLDAAFLLQAGGLEWSRCRQVAEELHQPYSGDLLGAFPDFFPPEVIQAMAPDADRAKAYREIYENRHILADKTHEDWQLSSDRAFTAKWLKQRLRLCSFAVIRQKHHLPENAIFRTAWYFCGEVLGKVFRSARHFSQDNSQLKRYFDNIEIAEGRKSEAGK